MAMCRRNGVLISELGDTAPGYATRIPDALSVVQ
jgi:hypothetical protein